MSTKQMLITITLIALLVIGLGWYMSNGEKIDTEMLETSTSTEINIPTPTSSTAIALPEIAGAILTIPDEGAQARITTETGTSSDDVLYSATFGEDESGFVAVVENRLAAISPTEFIVPFAVSSNGSGTFSYLGLLVDNDGQLEHVDSFFLGDRIRITDVAVTGSLITIETLDRHTDQTMSDDPMVVVVRELTAENGILKLLQEYYGTTPSAVSAEIDYDTDAKVLSLTGVAPRNWFFEGDFPVTISDEAGMVLYEGYATMLSTEDSGDRVPFVGEIAEASKDEKAWFVTLIKDNVSDDRSLDESYTMILD